MHYSCITNRTEVIIGIAFSFFFLGLLVSLISCGLFHQSGVIAGKKATAISFPVENKVELKVNDNFSTELLRLQNTGYDFQSALTQVLEQYVIENPLIRYYEGEILLEDSWWEELAGNKPTEGNVSSHNFSGTWRTWWPSSYASIKGSCCLYCEIELNKAPTIQL